MSRSAGRTSSCTRTDGAARPEDARAFLGVATLVLDEQIPDEDEAIIGRRFRGQDHRGAVDLVRTVMPGGPEMAKDLGRLLDLKDSAHYGVLGVSDRDARAAVERARRMVFAAKAMLTG